MNPSMINATNAMNMLQQKLDMLANNISNVDTIGYKRQNATFHDILTSHKDQHPAKTLPGRLTAPGLTLGWGAEISGLQLDFTQGSLMPTDVPTDIALEGSGLFEIAVPRLDENGVQQFDENGMDVFDRAWTRNGSFQLAPLANDPDNAYLSTADGHLLRTTEGALIPIQNGHQISIDDYGRVFSRSELDIDGSNAIPEYVGQLNIVHVVQPQMLESIGNSLFALPANVNVEGVLQEVRDVRFGDILEEGQVSFEQAGIAVRQGFLEKSNVNLIDEMTELINIQRQYQLSARALSSSDAMMGLAVQLRG